MQEGESAGVQERKRNAEHFTLARVMSVSFLDISLLTSLSLVNFRCCSMGDCGIYADLNVGGIVKFPGRKCNLIQVIA